MGDPSLSHPIIFCHLEVLLVDRYDRHVAASTTGDDRDLNVARTGEVTCKTNGYLV